MEMLNSLIAMATNLKLRLGYTRTSSTTGTSVLGTTWSLIDPANSDSKAR